MQRSREDETGYVAHAWRVPPTFHPRSGYSDEHLVCFEALGLTYSDHNMKSAWKPTGRSSPK